MVVCVCVCVCVEDLLIGDMVGPICGMTCDECDCCADWMYVCV